MDTNTFIIELIKALAWPVTALIMFLIVRKPLLRLLPQVQRLKVMEFELDFGEQVREVSAEVRRQLDVSPSLSRANRALHDHYERLAPLSPRAVILEAWLQLEDAAVAAARKANLGLSSQDLYAPKPLGEALEKAGILEGGTVKIYNDLRNLRNAAAHAAEFSIDSSVAMTYADSAIRLTEYLLSKG